MVLWLFILFRLFYFLHQLSVWLVVTDPDVTSLLLSFFFFFFFQTTAAANLKTIASLPVCRRFSSERPIGYQRHKDWANLQWLLIELRYRLKNSLSLCTTYPLWPLEITTRVLVKLDSLLRPANDSYYNYMNISKGSICIHSFELSRWCLSFDKEFTSLEALSPT